MAGCIQVARHQLPQPRKEPTPLDPDLTGAVEPPFPGHLGELAVADAQRRPNVTYSIDETRTELITRNAGVGSSTRPDFVRLPSES